MKANIFIGIGLLILAGLLFFLSKKGVLGDGLLDKADKIASVVSLITALIVFVYPLAKDGLKNFSMNNNLGIQQKIDVGGDFKGEINTGDVIVGDITTSAVRRAESALIAVKSELLNNFSYLGVLIATIERQKPSAYWDVRRANETELEYQDRARNEFRDYQHIISRYLDQLKFSRNAYDSFYLDLGHIPKMAEKIRQIYNQLDEVKDSFSRFENGLALLNSLSLTDTERTAKSLSLYKEKVVNSKINLVHAAGLFCVITNDKTDVKLLTEALRLGEIDIALQPGQKGFQIAMQMAAQYSQIKVDILRDRLARSTTAEKREIERRINDPYLLMLRKSIGLSSTLTEAELVALQHRKIDLDQEEPEKYFVLAAFSYLESDGHASTLYFDRAIESAKLTPLLEQYAEVSVHRIENPSEYEGNIGIFILRLTENGNFDQSGLNVGDVIISINGDIVNEPLDIASFLAKNQKIPILLSIVRDKEKMIIKVDGGKPAGALVSQLVVLNAIQL